MDHGPGPVKHSVAAPHIAHKYIGMCPQQSQMAKGTAYKRMPMICRFGKLQNFGTKVLDEKNINKSEEKGFLFTQRERASVLLGH